MALELTMEKALRELYAFHQVFMRLGFEPDEMWLAPRVLDPNGTPCVGVHVARGPENFNVSVCVVPDLRALFRAWPAFIDHMNAATQAERDEIYRQSFALSIATELLQGLVRKGGCFRAAVDDVSRARRVLHGEVDA